MDKLVIFLSVMLAMIGGAFFGYIIPTKLFEVLVRPLAIIQLILFALLIYKVASLNSEEVKP